MPDEEKKKKKKKVRVVVGDESSRHVDGSGAAPDIGVPLNDQFPPDPPPLSRVKRRGGEWMTRAQTDDESEIIYVGRPLSIVGGCELEGLTFEEAVGRAGLIPETETALDTAGLPIC